MLPPYTVTGPQQHSKLVCFCCMVRKRVLFLSGQDSVKSLGTSWRAGKQLKGKQTSGAALEPDRGQTGAEHVPAAEHILCPLL